MKLNNNDDSHNSGLNLLIYNMLLDIESHPAWVCGLKHFVFNFIKKAISVTPCVGVWIETMPVLMINIIRPSHPAWGCGLKLLIRLWLVLRRQVTPCVGVWIETLRKVAISWKTKSHPAWVCGLKRTRTYH